MSSVLPLYPVLDHPLSLAVESAAAKERTSSASRQSGAWPWHLSLPWDWPRPSHHGASWAIGPPGPSRRHPPRLLRGRPGRPALAAAQCSRQDRHCCRERLC